METLVERLFQEIRAIRLIDPHTHIDAHQPASTSLNDLLGYHYYTELAHSAGLERAAIETARGVELTRVLLTQLADCRNTVQYSWLVAIARDFLGFTKDEVTARDADALYETADRRMKEPTWGEKVWEETGLDALFLTNDFDDPLEGFDTKRFVPCLRTDDLVFKLHEAGTQARFEKRTGLSAAKILEGIPLLFEHFVRKNAKACAISLPPDFEPVRPGDGAFARALEVVLAGTSTTVERATVANGVFFALADGCEEFGLPFDLMIGVRRNVYEEGVHQGRDLFDQRTSLALYAKLFNEKRRVCFPISVLTHGQNQELVSFAWIFPNVVTSGHWWYSNIPVYIEADTRARLEAVPMVKQVGYYSDAYKLEFILPKFDMYRRCLARVLAEEFVTKRKWSEEKGVELARRILRGNVERIFAVG